MGFKNSIYSALKYTLWGVLFLLAAHPLFATTKVDSLKIALRSAKLLDDKYIASLNLASEYVGVSLDSANFYFEQASLHAAKLKSEEKTLDAAIAFCGTLFEFAQYTNAISVLSKALESTTPQTSPTQKAQILGMLGNCYFYKEDFLTSVSYYKQAVDYVERSGNPAEKANLLGRLGNVYYVNSDYPNAIDNYRQAGRLFKELDKGRGLATATMNIGNCYKKLNVYDSAHAYYADAYVHFRLLGNATHNEGQCLANIGNLFFEQNKYREARQYLLRADSLFSAAQNVYSIALVKRDLAYFYIETGGMQRALDQIEQGFEIAKANGFDYLTLEFTRLKWTYFDKLKDVDLAYTWLYNYMLIKDTIYQKEKQENIDRILLQYETEKKVKEIEILKQSREISQLKLKRRTLVQYITFAGLVLALTLSWFLHLSIQRRKRVNQLLTQHVAEINQQKEEIMAQRDEIESQRDMLMEQRNVLKDFQIHINDSLRYAQSIQAAILPSEKLLEQISRDYFVLIKPCELVSGDFFWATTFNEYQIFCVADCTGHGVPGAFMSILGITALNEVVVRHRVTKPSEILGHLRQRVIETLSQNDSEQHHKDGMDMALCVLNTKTRELQFAGAGLPLWLVTDDAADIPIATSEPTCANGFKLFEVKGDILPVGQSPLLKPFTNHSIDLKGRSVAVYLATDGFADQFGGEGRVKFGGKRLKASILETYSNPFAFQNGLLQNIFARWIGDSYQVDDVTILAMKL